MTSGFVIPDDKTIKECSQHFIHSLTWSWTSCLLASPTWIRDSSKSDYLCEEDSKGPDVWFDAKCPKVNGLWSRPFDGELSTCARKISFTYSILQKSKIHPQSLFEMLKLGVSTALLFIFRGVSETEWWCFHHDAMVIFSSSSSHFHTAFSLLPLSNPDAICPV